MPHATCMPPFPTSPYANGSAPHVYTLHARIVIEAFRHFIRLFQRPSTGYRPLARLPRDLCTYAKHRQSRGCPMDKGLSADSWPPEFSDFCLVCLPPLFFGFLLFACLGISPLFRLLVPPKLKLIWFLCAPSLTSGFLLIRWNCTCAGRFVLFGHLWNFR